MDSTTDPLYQIFIEQLHDPSISEQSNEDFITEVVGAYMFLLFQQGHVPERWALQLEMDLREEVLEMLRKTIYGHSSIESYRASLSKRRRLK